MLVSWWKWQRDIKNGRLPSPALMCLIERKGGQQSDWNQCAIEKLKVGFNLYIPNVSFLHLLKTSKGLWLFDVFRGYSVKTLEGNELGDLFGRISQLIRILEIIMCSSVHTIQNYFNSLVKTTLNYKFIGFQKINNTLLLLHFQRYIVKLLRHVMQRLSYFLSISMKTDHISIKSVGLICYI